ncbi:MAG: DNA translocase FtsK [Planctomycetota bacterium]|nr:DNA translocase FtsK [Planctomycetota bacterium]
MNEQRQRASGEWIGLTLFTLGAFTAVLVCLVLFKDTPRDAASGTAALGWSVVGAFGVSAALVLSAGLAILGALAFLGLVRNDFVRHAGGVVGTALGLSVLTGALSMDGGGSLGAITGGNLTAVASVFVGAGIGLCALLAPLWLAWGSLLPERPLQGGRQEGIAAVLSEKHADGVTEAEAAALMPTAQGKTKPRNGLETPSRAAINADCAETETIPAPATSPYPEDVRRRGEIPAGAMPLTSDETTQPFTTDGHDESESAHDPAPVEAGLAENDHEQLATGEDLATQAAGQDAEASEGFGADVGECEPESDSEDVDEGGEALAGTPAEEFAGEEELAEEELAGEDEAAGDEEGVAEEESAEEDGGAEDDMEDDEPAARVPSPSWEQPALFAEIESEIFPAPEEGSSPEDDVCQQSVADDDGECEEAPELAEEAEEEYEDEDGEEGEYEDEEEEYDEEEYEEEGEEADELDDEEEATEEDEEYDEEEEYEEEEEDYEETAELDGEEEAAEEDEEYDEEEDSDEAAELDEETEASDNEGDEAGELAENVEVAEAEAQVVLEPQAPPEAGLGGDDDPKAADLMVGQAGELFIQEGRVAVSMLQKRFSIDFDDACRILDTLQELGLIGPYQGGQTRDILMTADEWSARTAEV